MSLKPQSGNNCCGTFSTLHKPACKWEVLFMWAENCSDMEGTNCPLTLAVIIDNDFIKNKCSTIYPTLTSEHGVKHLMNTPISFTCHNDLMTGLAVLFWGWETEAQRGKITCSRFLGSLRLPHWSPERHLGMCHLQEAFITLSLGSSVPDSYFLCGPCYAIPWDICDSHVCFRHWNMLFEGKGLDLLHLCYLMPSPGSEHCIWDSQSTPWFLSHQSLILGCLGSLAIPCTSNTPGSLATFIQHLQGPYLRHP